MAATVKSAVDGKRGSAMLAPDEPGINPMDLLPGRGDLPDLSRSMSSRYRAITGSAWEPGYKLPWQRIVKEFYQNQRVQVFVACLIGLNFATNVIEKEIDPYPEGYQKYGDTWQNS